MRCTEIFTILLFVHYAAIPQWARLLEDKTPDYLEVRADMMEDVKVPDTHIIKAATRRPGNAKPKPRRPKKQRAVAKAQHQNAMIARMSASGGMMSIDTDSTGENTTLEWFVLDSADATPSEEMPPEYSSTSASEKSQLIHISPVFF